MCQIPYNFRFIPLPANISPHIDFVRADEAHRGVEPGIAHSVRGTVAKDNLASSSGQFGAHEFHLNNQTIVQVREYKNRLWFQRISAIRSFDFEKIV